MTDVISKCPDMENAFLKAISRNNLSNICCWQPSIDFCQNVSKLQLFLESEQKKFYSPADFHARLLSSLIPLQNGIKSAPRGNGATFISSEIFQVRNLTNDFWRLTNILDVNLFSEKDLCNVITRILVYSKQFQNMHEMHEY